MTIVTNRRHFLAASPALLLLPQTLLAINSEPAADGIPLDTPDRDIEKILRELPHARPHLERLPAICEKYAKIFPIPVVLAAKILAIESNCNTDAISNSYAVGCAQFMHPTARDLGAILPDESEFKDQEEVLSLRRQYSSKMNQAVEAFRKENDDLARALRTESAALKTKHDMLHDATMAAFKKRMFALTPEQRRALDPRFDPAASDDMLVHYLAILARGVKNDLDLTDTPAILLLAGVAYNAGPGSVKRKPGIPVVAQNVEYANKIMLFQQLKL